jgi:hypothetical protein
MTASDATEPTRIAAAPAPAVAALDTPAEWPVRPMPRLGRGIVWSDIVAEIERDNAAGAGSRLRDAA